MNTPTFTVRPGCILPAHYDVIDRIRRGIQIHPETGCWEWTRSLSLGYGRIKYAGRLDLTHRVMYHLTIGDLLPGMQVDHLCRNRKCCNPAHLEQVTPLVNQQRGMPRATVCIRGHDLTGDNRHPRFGCLECKRIRLRAYKARRRRLIARVEVERWLASPIEGGAA